MMNTNETVLADGHQPNASKNLPNPPPGDSRELARPDELPVASGVLWLPPTETGGQMELIEGESDAVLLLPPEELSKRFTAATVARVERQRNYIVDLLGFQMPVEMVARRTKSSERIVKLIGSKYAELVAANAGAFARYLKAKAAKFAFLADQKAGEAKFGELAIATGIFAQRAAEAEVAAMSSDATEKTLDVKSENENERKFREAVAARKKLGAGS